MQCSEAALRAAAHNGKSAHGPVIALENNITAVREGKQLAEQAPSGFGNQDLAGFGCGLEPSCEVGGFAGNWALLGRAGANQLTHDHKPSCYANPSRHTAATRDAEIAHDLGDGEASSHRALRVILM